MKESPVPTPWAALDAALRSVAPGHEFRLFWKDDEVQTGVPPSECRFDLTDGTGTVIGWLNVSSASVLSATTRDTLVGLGRMAVALRDQDREQAFQRLLARHLLHDVRTPMTIVQGYGDVLRSQLPAQDQLDRGLAAIVEQSGRLRRIAQDYALASGLQVPATHCCDGTDLAGVLGEERPITGPKVPPVRVEASLLRDILERLATLVRQIHGDAADVRLTVGVVRDQVCLSWSIPGSTPVVATCQRLLRRQVPPAGQDRVNWLLRLVAAEQLVLSQGGHLQVVQDEQGVHWQCDLPLVQTPGNSEDQSLRAVS